MKRGCYWIPLVIVLLTGVLLTGELSRAQTAPQQPVFVYLHARVTDYVNLDLAEDRLHRIATMLDRYRKAHPEAAVSATILVSGAMSQALEERNDQTGIKNFLQGLAQRDLVQRGLVELGYDGTDEPTYARRPVPDFSKAKTSAERWLARGDAAERLLTEARDPLVGYMVPGSGGLKKMQEVFGEAATITGVTDELGGDSEVVQHVGRYNSTAIMFGIPDPNLLRPIPGYRGSAMEFGRLMSPIPESSPDLYWQDNVLRSSEFGTGIRLVQGYEGVDAMKDILRNLDRSRVRIIHVELGSERIYMRAGPLYPPLKLAFANPERRALPETARHDADEVSAAYAKEDALLKWLVKDFFPANPGSRFVSNAALKQMTPPSTGFNLFVDPLRAAVTEIVKAWGGDTFPPAPKYFQVDGHYLSVADLFLVMTDALAELHRKGKLPVEVRVARVYGPVEIDEDTGPNLGEATVAEVARICAEIVDSLHDETWNPIPKNAIPSRFTVNGAEINAAQFLRLMAEALVSPSPQSKLKIKMTQMFPGAGVVYPKTRLPMDQGATWTFKPAPLGTGQASRSGQ